MTTCGAFIAGMVIASTDDSHRISRAIDPFRMIDQHLFQSMLTVIVVTMIVTPSLIALSPTVAARIAPPVLSFMPLGSRPAPSPPVHVSSKTIVCCGEIHTVIIGFGLNGRNVAAVLNATNLIYSALEIDRQVVRWMRKRGEPVFYGDCTDRKSLLRVGIDHARSVVIAIADVLASIQCIRLVRELNREAFIIVRTRTPASVGNLYRAGADAVVTEKFETSIQIVAELLNHFRVEPETIREQQEIMRREASTIFRGQSAPDLAPPTGVKGEP